MSLNVELRDPVDSDIPALFRHQEDPEGCRMAAVQPRGWDDFLAHWAKLSRNPEVVQKVVCVDGRVAGSIGSWRSEEGLRLVGYVYGRETWGRGLATKALAHFLELVPERPLHAFVAKHNVGSVRVLEKNGFTVVEERRCPPDSRSPEWIDELLMRLAHDERACAGHP